MSSFVTQQNFFGCISVTTNYSKSQCLNAAILPKIYGSRIWGGLSWIIYHQCISCDVHWGKQGWISHFEDRVFPHTGIPMCSLALSFPWLLSSPLQIAYISTVSLLGRFWIPLTNINSKELQERTKLGPYLPGQQSVG